MQYLTLFQVAGIRLLPDLYLAVYIFLCGDVFRFRPAVCNHQLNVAPARNRDNKRFVFGIELVDHFFQNAVLFSLTFGSTFSR